MVSHRAINDIMQTPKKEVHFFFFSVCCIVFNCSWQLIMFNKKAKKLCKTYSFSNWWWFIWLKSFFYKIKKNIFFHPLWMMANLSIIKIVKGFDNPMSTGMILLELQKAFDTINHTILLDKLLPICISKNMISCY